MNKQRIKDLHRSIKDEPVKQVLEPGSTGRRYEPIGGVRKHNESIHRESKIADDWKNLPFKFSKPRKAGRQMWASCVVCSHVIRCGVNTIMMACPECNKKEGVSKNGRVYRKSHRRYYQRFYCRFCNRWFQMSSVA